MTGQDAGSDAEIVASVLAGNADAYAWLVARYRDAYTRFALRMLGNMEDADDALQSAFVRAYRKLGDCRQPDRFGAWLYQIVINECRTFSQRRTRRERHLVHDQALLDLESIEPADLVMRNEIQSALDQLDADQREAFLLKHVEGLSYEEMCIVTGAGESALKMRVKRACARLRELLQGAIP